MEFLRNSSLQAMELQTLRNGTPAITVEGIAVRW